ncbi:hypothetical protein GGI07_005471 [Coemansia sp. Benny D115]|nr:hypothetical protein GGI07_005471 [Coemansia sp. Benny D115]
MEYIGKLKSKFERLTASHDDKPPTGPSSSQSPYGNSPYPPPGSQTKKHHHSLHGKPPQQQPQSQPEHSFPTPTPWQGPPGGSGYDETIGPGGFFAPPPPSQFPPYGGDAASPYGTQMPGFAIPSVTFPGQSAYPPYPPQEQGAASSAYPPMPDHSNTYPPATNSSPYPPINDGNIKAPPSPGHSSQLSAKQQPYPPTASEAQGSQVAAKQEPYPPAPGSGQGSQLTAKQEPYPPTSNSGHGSQFAAKQEPYPPTSSAGGQGAQFSAKQEPYPPVAGSSQSTQQLSAKQEPYPPQSSGQQTTPSFAQAPYPPPGSQQGTPAASTTPASSDAKLVGSIALTGLAASAVAAGAIGAAGAADEKPKDEQSVSRGDTSLQPQQQQKADFASNPFFGQTLSDTLNGVPLPLDKVVYTSTVDGEVMQFMNVANNETVHQRFMVVTGQVPDVKGDKDKIVVHHPFFPPLTFPAVDGYFKVLVELENGDNGLKFDYLHEGSRICQGELNIKMTPYLDRPALRLVVLLGSNSEGIFDAPPDARGPGVNDLDAAIRKFRCCAYLWQAFVSEQLYRNGFGRRTFRLEESYEPDTMARDNMNRMTAKVHVVRSERTVAEIQDKERAQQWNPPPGYQRKTDESQFSLAADALKEHGGFSDGNSYIACLTLDSHWDPDLNVILGHAALGGGTSESRLGVFGSHTTHAWPSNAEEVATKFLDTTKTDTRILANDCNECGEYWRAANIGMGAFLHECGHLLTLAHTPSGVMSRGFNDYNRTFMASAPNWDGPVKQRDEAGAHWHRTDIIRLRHHPCLRLPTDPPLRNNETTMSEFDTLVFEDGLQVQNSSGITMIEVWVNDRYRNHREYTAENYGRRRSGALPAEADEASALFPQTVMVNVNSWKQWAGGWADSDKVTLVLTSRASATEEGISDINKLIREGSYKNSDGLTVFTSGRLGKGEMGGTEQFKVEFAGKDIPSSAPKLRKIEVRSGNYVDGFILHLTDGSEQRIGRCAGGSASVLDIDEDDDLDHIVVNSGWWIDGLEFITRKGKRSGWKGGNGGGRHIVKPPSGYGWMGLSGSGAAWLDSLTMHYTKRW